MYVVTVEIVIKPEYIDEFVERMMQQANDSLELEEHCHTFDVCRNIGRAERIFLYEIYSDEVAFKHHLESAHFKSFDAASSDWVESKCVAVFERL